MIIDAVSFARDYVYYERSLQSNIGTVNSKRYAPEATGPVSQKRIKTLEKTILAIANGTKRKYVCS